MNKTLIFATAAMFLFAHNASATKEYVCPALGSPDEFKGAGYTTPKGKGILTCHYKISGKKLYHFIDTKGTDCAFEKVGGDAQSCGHFTRTHCTLTCNR